MHNKIHRLSENEGSSNCQNHALPSTTSPNVVLKARLSGGQLARKRLNQSISLRSTVPIVSLSSTSTVYGGRVFKGSIANGRNPYGSRDELILEGNVVPIHKRKCRSIERRVRALVISIRNDDIAPIGGCDFDDIGIILPPEHKWTL